MATSVSDVSLEGLLNQFVCVDLSPESQEEWIDRERELLLTSGDHPLRSGHGYQRSLLRGRHNQDAPARRIRKSGPRHPRPHGFDDKFKFSRISRWKLPAFSTWWTFCARHRYILRLASSTEKRSVLASYGSRNGGRPRSQAGHVEAQRKASVRQDKREALPVPASAHSTKPTNAICVQHAAQVMTVIGLLGFDRPLVRNRDTCCNAVGDLAQGVVDNTP